MCVDSKGAQGVQNAAGLLIDCVQFVFKPNGH